DAKGPFLGSPDGSTRCQGTIDSCATGCRLRRRGRRASALAQDRARACGAIRRRPSSSRRSLRHVCAFADSPRSWRGASCAHPAPGCADLRSGRYAGRFSAYANARRSPSCDSPCRRRAKRGERAFGAGGRASPWLAGAPALWARGAAPLLARLGLRLDRRAPLQVYAQAVAVLHERMPAVGELGLFALALARLLRLLGGGGGMGVVAAPLAAEVDHPIGAPACRGRTILGFEALLARPSLDQSAVDGEVLVGEQPRLTRLAHHRVEEPPPGALPAQPLAQPREVRLVQPRLVQAHVQEPAKQQVVVEHLA